MHFERSFNKLIRYIESENFIGYDPYDTLNSWIPFKLMGRWGPVIATQVQKRNPVNIRVLMGIKKEINPKAFGLFLQAYSILYQKTAKEEYLKRADYFYDWLKQNNTEGYSGVCWGYNFPWASKTKYLKEYTPSAVVTGFVANGLFEYYKIRKSHEVHKLIESACMFLDNDLEKVSFSEGISISYTPVQKDVCYNASLLAAEVFAKEHSISKNEAYKKIAIQAVDYVISKQKSDGHWEYSLNLDTGNEQHQVDFHQGYILESIFEIKKALKADFVQWDDALRKGLKFYIGEQFNESGRSYWRLPKKYPVEIHNQSQGIITLRKLVNFHPEAKGFIQEIANWTINNMQAGDGHFYYQKFKTHTNKISYMRWSQAWMFLAFANLVEPQK